MCAQMKWTYQQYISQPTWFIELMKHKNSLYADYERIEAEKAKRKKK